MIRRRLLGLIAACGTAAGRLRVWLRSVRDRLRPVLHRLREQGSRMRRRPPGSARPGAARPGPGPGAAGWLLRARLVENRAALTVMEARLAAIERRLGIGAMAGPGASPGELDERIAAVQREKEAALDAEDFGRARRLSRVTRSWRRSGTW